MEKFAMKLAKLSLVLLAATLFAAAGSHAQSLLENGKFDNPAEPLKGWITDYEWTGNTNYVNNKKCISVVTENGKHAAKMNSPGEQGAKMECKPVPREAGFRYTCNLDVKGDSYRIYFAGYKWAPGVKPHDNPDLSELRMIYQSKATTGSSNEWKREKIEVPSVKLSPEAQEHLKQVRFLTIYIWFLRPGFVSDVTLSKSVDASMNF